MQWKSSQQPSKSLLLQLSEVLYFYRSLFFVKSSIVYWGKMWDGKLLKKRTLKAHIYLVILADRNRERKTIHTQEHYHLLSDGPFFILCQIKGIN